MNFTSTDWSALAIARNRKVASGADAFAQLIEAYRPAMLFYVGSHFRLSVADAEEIVQQFILDRMIEKNLLEQADRSRGKFRAFLVTTLNRFVIDWHRRSSARPPLVLLSEALDPAVESLDPFDLAWAETVITEALSRTAAELEQGGRANYWELFHARVVEPAYSQPMQGSYAELSERLGFESPRAASNALATAKRTFERVLDQILDEQEQGRPHESVVEVLKILSRRATAGRTLRRTD